MIESIEKGIERYKVGLEMANEELYRVLSCFSPSVVDSALKIIRKEIIRVKAMEYVLKISTSEREKIIRETELVFPVEIFDASYEELTGEMIRYWELKG